MSTSVYPAEFFQEKVARKPGYCFVLMPFAAELRNVFETIKSAVEGDPFNLVCKRADDFFRGGHILTDILRSIGEAEVVIADLTDRNPNVFYELGITHMVKKSEEVLLLTQNMESIPFDLRSFRSIEYQNRENGLSTLQEKLGKALGEMGRQIYRITLLPGQPYHFPHRLFGDDRCLYDFTLFGDYVGIDGAKLTIIMRRYAAGEQPQDLGRDYWGLGSGQSRKVPHVPWELRLDNAEGTTAAFTLFRSRPKENATIDAESTPGSARSLAGDIGSDGRSASTWIYLPKPLDLKRGQRLRFMMGNPKPGKPAAKKVIVRFLRYQDDENEPLGVITPREGVLVPPDGMFEVTVPADFQRLRAISLHGGSNPWKQFPLGRGNGAPRLLRVDLL